MSMMDVWLGMLDSMLIARCMISMCGSWMTMLSMPLIGLRHKTQ